jgi:hypothetical protein
MSLAVNTMSSVASPAAARERRRRSQQTVDRAAAQLVRAKGRSRQVVGYQRGGKEAAAQTRTPARSSLIGPDRVTNRRAPTANGSSPIGSMTDRRRTMCP